ncbi:hypothetical protein Pst134EA_004887 [Puccinia striiformis f. sp. tritici]|uniref:Uncharacterized protein n=1 Tax=Puccinia striiformis f. sp. tritici PST-78 TaxID=1165861 RepID=A0A0L0V0S4_9BASI|nr:hypothetical protein Pst134EA_004887 [Puccinia striiformis f. sp. tritici]KAH9470977.1 hypothetical protein Pst134EA_004887 [Puccinia striiformis f. sp. tritici]KAI9624570.1 hypothetical protein H4Q26_016799 [Puccinia striiformis f. sp. tritici PST-130]KNE92604.1 hypothetical protein PSTG_13990 [Puccinia striiformis f. sp. tritici PST-78]
MGPHYACPHLPTCGDIKYNKKPCREHSCLNLTQVKFHTLNPKIHRYCGPGCPAYALDVEEFAFQIYASDSSAILATNEKAIRNIGAKSVIHHRSAKRTEGNKRNLSSRLDQQSRILPAVRIVLRIIAYGILVGTWSQSRFLSTLAHPNQKSGYLCQLACTTYRSWLMYFYQVAASEEICLTALQLGFCALFVF